MQYKIAFVGEKDIVYPFGMLGLETFFVHEADEARRVAVKLVEDGFGVIFVTERAYGMLTDVLARYAGAYMPAFIPIPSDFDGESLGLKRIEEAVKLATGQKLL